MTRVVVATVRLVEFVEGAGHFWVYMQYVDALRRLGCDVRVLDSGIWDGEPEPESVDRLRERMQRFDLGAANLAIAGNGSPSDAAEVVGGADLLLNFNYHLPQSVVSAARRSALVDIDPGLLQFWISRGFIAPAVHETYFTTGETVGTPGSPIPDCGIDWSPIRPAVSLELWPYTHDPAAEAFTAVSTWWGERDYVGDPDDYYDNTKRTAFFEFLDLPRHTDQPLEVALFLADSDESDRRTLERRGWRVRHSREVAATPEQYRDYVQRSRAEFGWAKASCARLQNAWISDRTLCYLASGKPVAVQDTGPSAFLPRDEGLFRFTTVPEAAEAIAAINADYERQGRLARKLAEEHFDARRIVAGMLERAL